MRSVRPALCKFSLLATAFCGLIGLSVLIFGQESETTKTGVPDDWSHHHLIFSNPGTATQAISEGRFLEWYRIVTDPRYKLQQVKRSPADASLRQAVGAMRADAGAQRAKPAPAPPAPKSTQNTLKRDWQQPLGPAPSTNVYVAPGMTGAIFEANPSSPSPSDYAVFGVAATPSGTQPNLVGITNLYATTPSVKFAYAVGTGPVITSPSLGPGSGTVVYIESASPAVFHALKGAGVSGSNGTVSSPVAPGTGNGASDSAITLNGSPTVTYSSVFYDYGDDAAYVGDDNGYLHKFSPVFAGPAQEVVAPAGGIVWPALISSGHKLTSPVLDPGSGRLWVSDGSSLYSVSPTYGSGTGSAIVASASLGSDIVDAPIVDGGNGLVYIFVGSVPEVARFSIATFPLTTQTAIVGTGSPSVPIYDGDFNNVYYNSVAGTGTLNVCGNPGGNPILYQVAISSGTLGSVTQGPVLANANVACSPLVEYFNTHTSTDWLFGGVPANSCGATGGTTAGGCVMSFNIGSATNYGPWTPNTTYAANAEVVDTSGNLQKTTAGGASFSVTPAWTTGTTTEATPNPSVTAVTQNGTLVSVTNSSSTSSITFSSATLALNPNTGTLAPSATGTITPGSDPSVGDSVTVGSIAYNVVNSNPATGGTAAGLNVFMHPGNAGHGSEVVQNLYAAITGVTSNCSTAGCFSPTGLTWTYQSASNGQTTAPAPTGTSGLIIDNSGSTTGEANIYFGTLSGTGAQSSAIKLSQSGLH